MSLKCIKISILRLEPYPPTIPITDRRQFCFSRWEGRIFLFLKLLCWASQHLIDFKNERKLILSISAFKKSHMAVSWYDFTFVQSLWIFQLFSDPFFSISFLSLSLDTLPGNANWKSQLSANHGSFWPSNDTANVSVSTDCRLVIDSTRWESSDDSLWTCRLWNRCRSDVSASTGLQNNEKLYTLSLYFLTSNKIKWNY